MQSYDEGHALSSRAQLSDLSGLGSDELPGDFRAEVRNEEVESGLRLDDDAALAHRSQDGSGNAGLQDPALVRKMVDDKSWCL